MHKKFSFSIRVYAQILLVSTLVISSMASQSWASGGGGGLSSELPRSQRQIDEAYEYGKAVFKGRVEGAEKIKYCIKHDDEIKKLKRSTLKPYRKGPTRDFALALYDCNAPDRLALSTMPREHVPAVLYYLNKRYKLKLEDS